MHSSLVRLQNVFGFFTTVAFTVAAVIALSVLIQPQTPIASLELKKIQIVKGRAHFASKTKEEYAHIRFELDADLTSLFHWNTKQIFLYVTATYPSDSPSTVPPSEAVIWDAIIPALNAPWHQNTYIHPAAKLSAGRKKSKSWRNAGTAWPTGAEPGIIRLTNQRPKYQITDYTGKLAEQANVTLQLKWNVQPWVGALVWTNRNDIGRWQGLQGGQSEVFDFPSLKGPEAKKEELPIEIGEEKNRGAPA